MREITTLCAALALFCIAPSSAAGQEVQRAPAAPASPAWVVEQFFVADSFPQRGDYLTGEMAGYADAPTMRAYIPASVPITIRELERRGGRAVYAVAVHDPERPTDWYAYLYERRPGRWALGQLRSLALPPLFFHVLDTLSVRRQLADSLAVEREVMRLTASSDSTLRAYLRRHEAALTHLAHAFLAQPAPTVARRGTAAAEDQVQMGLRELRLSALYRDAELPGCVLLAIGGMVDNEAGFLYVPAGCTPPQMDPGRFIYVERVRGPWYVYKTT